MKLNLKLKRIGTVLVTTILMTAALGKPCTADTGSPVIDPEKTGSLTIYKISENNGNVYEGNGKVEVNFKSGVKYNHVKIAVKDAAASPGVFEKISTVSPITNAHVRTPHLG